jgi:CheY-like chemotaxis protein
MRPNGKRILIVDDDEDMCALLTDLFRRVGYGAASCRDGAAALLLLKRIPPPDLFMVDLRMPDMSGEQLIELIRADPRFSAVPFIVVSAAVTPDLASTLRVDAFVRKPFKMPDLEAMVGRLCFSSARA